MKLSRREFLNTSVKYTIGAFFSAPILLLLRSKSVLAAKEGNSLKTYFPEGYDWEKHSYAYLIRVDRCIGCGNCVRACQKENNVPEDFYRTWVERYEVSEIGETFIDSHKGGIEGVRPIPTGFKVTKAFFVPKMCNHCINTPCTQVCPVGASYTTKEGAVLVDNKHCIGCGYCVQACPYGSRFLNPITRIAEKCTWCYHRIVRGMLPACVQMCPTGARQFGDLHQQGDPVRTAISTEHVLVLQPELLTKPRCYYIGLDIEVV